MATNSVERFAKIHGIGIRSEWTDHNGGMEDRGANMDNWRVTLTHKHLDGSRRMSLTFSKGYGHNGAEPTVDEVLDCLASDAGSIDNATDFEDWAMEFGYDTDSRSAERTYNATERQTRRFRAFLGDCYDELVYHTERL